MIHYHGTPCGGTREEAARFLSGRHALIPWQRNEDLGAAADFCDSFCFDNSAFTAWKSGQPITNWRGYYEWCLEWYRHPGFAFAIIPDVIDGSADDNDRMMTEWYKHVLPCVQCAPVWHLHESTDRLRHLCETHRLMRVCLGSSGDYSEPGTLKWWNRIAEAMKVACDEQGRPIARLHGLRMLDPAIFHRLPLASADSTNAVRNGSNFSRYGTYIPPTSGQRQSVNGWRIESHQSAAVWVPMTAQPVLAFELERQSVLELKAATADREE